MARDTKKTRIPLGPPHCREATLEVQVPPALSVWGSGGRAECGLVCLGQGFSSLTACVGVSNFTMTTCELGK